MVTDQFSLKLGRYSELKLEQRFFSIFEKKFHVKFLIFFREIAGGHFIGLAESIVLICQIGADIIFYAVGNRGGKGLQSFPTRRCQLVVGAVIFLVNRNKLGFN